MNFLKTRFFVLTFMIFQTISNNCETETSPKYPSIFPPYSTEQFLYTKSVEFIPADQDSMVIENFISDITTEAYFSNGITRQLITQKLYENQIIITTETWKTKSPSYITWTNFALLVIVANISKFIDNKMIKKEINTISDDDLKKQKENINPAQMKKYGYSQIR